MGRLILSCVPTALQRRLQKFFFPALLALLASTGPVHAQSFDIQRISVNSAGEQANAYSPAGALSADGRYVVFRSDATNLVANDTNGATDVFVHDRATRTTTRVSVGTGGVQANGPSHVDAYQLISRDGRYVVFASNATNLVPGDTNGATDVFLHDRVMGQTQRVSLNSLGQQAPFDSNDPHISADGQVIVFTSASALVPGAPYGIYARTRVTGQVSHVSRSTAGTPANNGSYRARLSADGRHVAFESFGDNLVPGDTNSDWDVFLHDRQTGVTSRISVSAEVPQAGAGSFYPFISGNGRFVTFATAPGATLSLDDTNGAEDVWVHDRDTDRDGVFDEPGTVKTFRISKSAVGIQGNAFSLGSTMSYDGRFATVTSDSDNLLGPGQDQNGARDVFLYELDVDGDLVFDEPGDQRVTRVSVALDGVPGTTAGGGHAYTHDISDDGRYIHFDSNASDHVHGDTNNVMDSFVVDRLAWKTTTSMAPTTSMQRPRISGNGAWSVFSSADATLAPADTNGQVDVFVRNRRLPLGAPNAVVRVSVATSGAQALGGASDQASISADGRFVVFRSAAVNLVPLDTNGVSDVFLHDRDTDLDGILDEPGARRTSRVSVATGGVPASGGASETPDISPDGRYIVFSSLATNLIPGANGFRQVFLHERLTGTTIRLSERNGLPADADALTPVVANNGTAAFATAANNLWAFEQAGTSDVYFSRIVGGARIVVLASQRAGLAVPGDSSAPALSADGLIVAFQSTAATLVHDDTNGVDDIFIAPTVTLYPYEASVVRLSVTRTQGSANGSSGAPSVSADLGPIGVDGGQFVGWRYDVAYTSAASNLVFGDTNGIDDVFVTRVNVVSEPEGPSPRRDALRLTTRASLDGGGGQFATPSGISSISANGTRVEYERPLPVAPASGTLLVYDRLDPKSVPGTGGVRYNTLSVSEIVPSSGAPGSVVTITGTGLDNPDVVLTLDVPLAVLERTDTWLRAATNPGGAGQHALLVNGPGEDAKSASASGSISFQYETVPSCGYGPAPPDQTFGTGAEGRNVTVAATPGCRWSLQEDAPWITLSRSDGVGTQNVQLTVAPNPDPQTRRVSISVTGGSFEVIQSGAGCSYAIQAGDSNVWPSTPSTGAVRITTATSCPWSVAGSTPWVTFRQAQGEGLTDLHYDVAANPGAARAFTFTVAGHPYTIHQAGTDGRTLQITRIGNGRVTSTPARIDCGASCGATFDANSQVTLQAQPDAGFTFEGWSGACAGSGACSIAMNVDQGVTARFGQGTVQHTLTVTKGGTGAGRVVSAPARIDCGATCAAQFDAGSIVTLGAEANAGSHFERWEGDCSGNQVTMTLSRTCRAVFDLDPTSFNITVTVNGPGRVTSVPTMLNCTGTCSADVAAASTITLIATPQAGYKFSWSGACTGSGVCQAQVSSNLAFTAAFTQGTGAPIAITDVQPRSGPGAGGTVLRITGTGFDQTGNGVSVTVGGVPATAVDIVTDTLLVARTGAVPDAPVVATTGEATVVQTGDVVVNVGGATATMAAAYRAVALTGSAETDTDGDGLPDTYEALYDLDVLVPDSLADPDGDGAANLQEYQQGTHPRGYYKRYLAEGATGSFFDTRISAANAGTVPATALLRFQPDAGPNQVQRITIPGRERRYTYPRWLPSLASANFSTVVESNTEIVVDRSMFWPGAIYGSHAETSVASPSTTWYLAEGATGAAFDLFYLIQNPDLTRAAEIRIRYLRPAGPPIVETYLVPPATRRTLYVDQITGLEATDVSGVVESTNGVAIMVERAMYLTRNGQTFGGGHDSAGVTSPATSWFLAEGATGGFFDTFVLLANPSASDAQLLATFMRPDGVNVTRSYTVPANSRRTIQVDGVDPLLAATSVATSIVSTNGVGVIVERAMYWPGPEATSAFWHEAHNSPGSTETGTKWAVADGETGPPPVNTTTYYLIANTSPFEASVKVSLLFEIGVPPAEKTFTVAANGRFTVSVGSEFPSSRHRGYGAIIESIGPTPAQIVVERAMYSDSEGVFWAAGTNVLATKLK